MHPSRFLRVEPVAITSAIAATLGILVLLDVLSEDIAGAILVAVGAWLVVVRQMVTPTHDG